MVNFPKVYTHGCDLFSGWTSEKSELVSPSKQKANSKEDTPSVVSAG